MMAPLQQVFAEMEAEARAALVRDFGADDVLFERFARDALCRPAPQHQGADLGLDDPAAHPRTPSTATTSAATATPTPRRRPSSRRCISPRFTRLRPPALERSAARAGAAAQPQYAPGLFRQATAASITAQIYDRDALAAGLQQAPARR